MPFLQEPGSQELLLGIDEEKLKTYEHSKTRRNKKANRREE